MTDKELEKYILGYSISGAVIDKDRLKAGVEGYKELIRQYKENCIEDWSGDLDIVLNKAKIFLGDEE